MAKRKTGIKRIQNRITEALGEAGSRIKVMGEETKHLLKKGEDELLKISKLGKAHLEILALNLKKEQLYRQIGMKVWQLSTKGRLTANRLRAFCNELSDINKKVKNKKRIINKTLRG